MIKYNENSFFANIIVRWIDYVLLFSLLLLSFSDSTEGMEFNVSFFLILFGTLLAYLITALALKYTDFYMAEPGTEEADKKVKFTLVYAAIAFALCTSLVFCVHSFFLHCPSKCHS